MSVMAIVLLAVFAGYTASFACVVLERRRDGRKPDGRSVCVCGATIPMYRNIPVVTWIAQRGHAACCDAKIPVWYVVAEAGTVATAMTAALAARQWFAGVIGIGVAVTVLALWHRAHFGAGRPENRYD
jgi:prepilin signal peptidase PulO-like enzyme (type II secretory pathway)